MVLLGRDKESSSIPVVEIISLQTGQPLDCQIKITGPVLAIHANQETVALASSDRIILLNSRTLAPAGTIHDVFNHADPNHGWLPSPVALGSAWLAYCSTAHINASNTPPQVPPTKHSSIASLVVTAQDTGADLWYLGGAGVKKVADLMNGDDSGSSQLGRSPPTRGRSSSNPNSCGTVRIVAPEATGDMRLVAHFRATAGNRPVASLAFDQSGLLLAVADTDGQTISVFNMAPPPSAPSTRNQALPIAPELVYTLVRGVTTALVSQMTFSPDSKWVAAVSDHGTVHLFPISPKGGAASTRTHSCEVPSHQFEVTAGIGISAERRRDKPISVHSAAKLRHLNSNSSRGVVAGTSAELKAGTSTPGSITKRLFSPAFVCFTNSTDLESDHDSTEIKTKPIELFAATTAGALLQYGIYPHSMNRISVQKVADQIRDTGAVIVHSGDSVEDGGIGSGLRSVLSGVHEFVSRPAEHDGTSSLGVTCAASRWWDLCRRRHWPSTVKDSVSGVEHPAANPSPDRIQAGLRKSDGQMCAPRAQEWQTQIDMMTYEPPHRRIWMGPQFTLHKIDDPELLPNGMMQGPLELPPGVVATMDADPTAKEASSNSVTLLLAAAAGSNTAEVYE